MTDHEPPVPFPLKDVPLKDDVGLLGALLGEVLKEQGGAALFDRVEAARLAARRRRAGDERAEAGLVTILAQLTPAEATEVTRAFSAYFGLVNMAERVHRIRRIRDYLGERETIPGSLAAALRTLRDDGRDLAAVRAALARVRLEPVLTAHPTEAVRRTLLQKEQRIARALVDRIERARPTPAEEAAALGRIRDEVTTAWQTAEHASVQPTVADEVEHIVFYLSEVVYRVIPAFYENLAAALREVYGEGTEEELPVLVRFASWVGGDMDGNPNAGAATIGAALERQRDLILRHYQADLRELFGHLSQSRSRVAVVPAVDERIARYRELWPEALRALPERYHDMPYRLLLQLVSTRLAATQADGPHGYADSDAFRADLELVAASLGEHRGRHAGRFLVRRLIRRVETFGFHLATLDVRQHALVHRRAVGALLGEPDFAARPPVERARRLVEALERSPAAGTPGPEAAPSLAVMQALAAARTRHGPRALGPFIVSMAHGPDDVLAVLYLARAAGFVDEGGAVPLDVAPLLETEGDLADARETLRALLAVPAYRRHLAARGDEQVLMLGYSDSNKEVGLAASRFALYRAEVELTEEADRQGLGLALFHGRGGTASRGGSKPRQGILAEPPGAVRGRLRVTEQGEIIHAKYGLRGIAVRTLELMAGAVLEATARSRRPAPDPRWLEAMGFLARESREAYRSLVYDDPDFHTYFREATPIDVIERLQIGSRPPRRQGRQGIEDLRAIPWVFAWTQSRHLLPGWYGLGTALERTAARFGADLIGAMARGWPFFANLLADVEMVIAKADLGIAAHYAALAGAAGERYFPRIHAELERTRTAVCAAQGEREILEREPSLAREIRLRNPYVDPMSLVQVDLLARWRATDREDRALLEALFTTVRGIARGLQNTG